MAQSNVTTNTLQSQTNGMSNGIIAQTVQPAIFDTNLIVSNQKMTVSVPLELNGLDVERILKDLMAVTGVISRNRSLEEEFQGLKKAGEAYEDALRDAKIEINLKIKKAAEEYCRTESKYKTFKTLKESK